MPENAYISAEFDADDVINGLISIVQNAEKIAPVLAAVALAGNKMADGLVNEFKRVADAVVKPLDEGAQLVARVDGVFKGVTQRIREISNQVDSVNMSPWQIQARKYAHELEDAQTELKKLEQHSKDVNLSEEDRLRMQRLLAQGQRELNQLAQEQKRHIEQLKDLEHARLVQQRAAKAEQIARQQSQAIDHLGQQVRGTLSDIRNVSAGAFTALSFGIATSVGKLGELDDELAQFRSVANATERDVKELVDTAKGIEGIKTTAAAQAAVALGRAGVEARAATRQLGMLSDASIVAGEAMDRVSKISLSTNKAFGRNITELANTVDILAAAANASDTSISEIGIGIGYVGSTARQSNQSLTEIAKVLAILQDAGIPASMAANSVQNSLFRLQSPAKEGKDVLDKLNLTLVDGKDKMLPFTQILDQLKGKLKNVSDTKQTDLLKKVFGEVGANAVLTYLNQTPEQIDKISVAVDNHAGEVDRSAKTIKESLGFEIRQMQKDFENFRLEIAEAVVPGIKELIKIASDAAKSFNGLTDESKEAFGQILLWGTGLTGVIAFLSALSLGVWSAVSAYTALKGAAIAAAEAQAVADAAAVAGGGRWAAFGSGLLKVGGPVLALTALAAAVYKVTEAIIDWNKAEKDFEEALTRQIQARQRSTGGLAAIANKEIKDLKEEEARKAAEDAGIREAEQKKLKKDIEHLREQLKKDQDEQEKQLRTISGVDPKLRNRIADIKKQLSEIFNKPFEKITDGDYTLKLKHLGKEIEGLSEKHKKLTAHVQELNKAKKDGDDHDHGSEDTGGGLNDDDFEDNGNKQLKVIKDRMTAALQELNIRKDHLGTEEAITEQRQAQMKLGHPGQGFTKTSPFGWRVHPIWGTRRLHTGEDFGAAKGTHIKSDVSGTVAFSGWLGGYGKAVIVDAGNGNYILYAHTSAYYKKVGEKVKKGEHIADVGSTGQSTGPHLHRELRQGVKSGVRGVANSSAYGSPVDPQTHSFINSGASDSAQEYRKQVRFTNEELQITKRTLNEVNELLRTGKLTEEERTEAQKESNSLSERQAGLESKLAKLSADYAKQRAKIIAEIQAEIDGIEAENERKKIALIKDDEKRLNAQFGLELDLLEQALATKLLRFEGTEQQRNDLIKAYREKAEILEEEYNERIILSTQAKNSKLAELGEKHQQNAINLMDDGIEKTLALVDLRYESEVRALNEQQERYKHDKEQYEKYEKLKRDAHKSYLIERVDAETDAEIKLAKARQDAIKSDLSQNANDFINRFTQIIRDRQKSGVINKNPLVITPGVAPLSQQKESRANLSSLAESLGGEDIELVYKSIVELSKEANTEFKKELDKLSGLEKGTQAYSAQLKVKNAARQRADEIYLLSLALQDEKLRGIIGHYRDILPEINEINLAQERFVTITNAVGESLAQIANIFGETGRNIGAAIKAGSSLITQFSEFDGHLSKAMEKVGPDGDVFGEIIGDPAAAKSAANFIVMAVTTAATVISQIMDRMNKDRVNSQKIYFDMETHDAQMFQDNARANIEKRRARGEDVYQEDITLIDQEVELRKRVMQNDLNLMAQDLGWFGWTSDETRAFMDKKHEVERESARLDREAVDRKEQSRIDTQQKKLDDERRMEEEAAQSRVLRAQLSDDQIAQIEADAEQRRVEINLRYRDRFNELKEQGKSQLQATLDQQAELAALERETNKKKREAHSETLRQYFDEESRKQEHIINLKEDGLQKELELLKFNKEKEGNLYIAELAKHEKHSDEYIRLTQERADAEESAQQRIEKAIESTAKKRKETMEDLSLQIESLKAGFTDNSVDDIAASAATSLTSLYREEVVARKQAIADFGEDQELLKAISESYALQRANTVRDAEKNAANAIFDDYEKAEKKKLEALTRPLEQSIRLEQRRVDELERANQERERELELIDERAQKELEEFERDDKTKFEALLAGVDLDSALGQGIDFIANTDLEGDKMKRSTLETQRRGLEELLKIQEQDAKSSLDLEEIDEAAFSAEIQRITILRAASAQALLKETEDEKKQSEIRAELAEQYLKYKDLIKDQIEEQRKADRKQTEQAIRNDEKEIRSHRNLIEDKQYDLEQLNITYEDKMTAMQNIVVGVTGVHQRLLAIIRQIGPAAAASFEQATSQISRFRSENAAMLNAMAANQGQSTYTMLDPDQIPDIIPFSYTQKPGYDVAGPDGRWYQNDQHMLAGYAQSQNVPGYAEGGKIPDVPLFRDDRAFIRVSGGEEVLNRNNSKKLSNLMDFWMPPANHAQNISNMMHAGTQQNNFYISRDVDMNVIDKVVGKHVKAEDMRKFRKMGQHGQRRN